jgi:hypothetical protein
MKGYLSGGPLSMFKPFSTHGSAEVRELLASPIVINQPG